MRNEFYVDPADLDERAAGPVVRYDETVAKAVDRLPKHLREIINAVYWEDISHPEAIRRFGLDRATYYRRLRQAKAQLQKALQSFHEVG